MKIFEPVYYNYKTYHHIVPNKAHHRFLLVDFVFFQRVQMAQDHESLRYYIIVDFQYILGFITVGRYPFHGHYSLVRQVPIRIQKVLLNDVIVRIRFQIDEVFRLLFVGPSHHEHNANVPEHASPCPCLAD